jgi:hypothetical protein
MTNEKRERALAALERFQRAAAAPEKYRTLPGDATAIREALQPSAVERVLDKSHDPRQDTDQPRGSLFEEDESMGLSFPCCACKHRSRPEVLCRPCAHCAR